METEAGRGWRELAKQVVLISCAILFYFWVRGLTEGNEATAVANGMRVLDIEASLGVAHEQTVQAWFSTAHWLTTAANWVYIWLHWPLIIATLIGCTTAGSGTTSCCATPCSSRAPSVWSSS